MKKIEDIRQMFKEKLKDSDFVIDKSGVRTVELIGESYIVNEETIFGLLNLEYVIKELEWYNSQSLNVYDMSKPPAIWKAVSDKDGYINSNYGWSIYSEDNFHQYKNCLRTLRKDKDSRRAMMIYTRPSIQEEYNKNGMSDYICTNTVQVLIRNDKLQYILNQRSCDAVFGAKNDLFWARHVQKKLYEDLKEDYPNLEIGDIIHQVGSLHVYERHFNLVELS